MEQLVGMPKAKKEKNQNKNPPTAHVLMIVLMIVEIPGLQPVIFGSL